ncbi:hypothetical protein PTSG_08339 [Salpingoeca rosetta]|uniref:Uncharacterized protein n=1 Tax=Salpingoeca rosetta (strain ATCC 50818 / BSB-021) TaxID=946362 RepID=F2UJE8_SALR5|nr:uncharacterized protein PTSG_08339 [Salpingoeca rosetta]EGD77247.1 hypothetical protein PTSG_08339 [Salpingoeca rosetta]|eukprot:XP_004990591.1 hypothetical protein PTSG_08339 [Salpingoeca rosetta]
MKLGGIGVSDSVVEEGRHFHNPQQRASKLDDTPKLVLVNLQQVVPNVDPSRGHFPALSDRDNTPVSALPTSLHCSTHLHAIKITSDRNNSKSSPTKTASNRLFPSVDPQQQQQQQLSTTARQKLQLGLCRIRLSSPNFTFSHEHNLPQIKKT